MKHPIIIILTCLIALPIVGCGSSNSGSAVQEDPVLEFPVATRYDFNEATFDENSAIITNPWLMYRVGRVTVFEGETEDGLERIELIVEPETKVVNGVNCAIVLDTVTIDGELVELTRDWFAQDTDGNVWYMGEEVADFENGVQISTSGSWEAGADILNIGFIAEAGIQMFAVPEVGTVYHQEFYETEAEDAAEIVDTAAQVTLSDGTQYTALKVKEWAPLEPTDFEYKYYVENVGIILETDMDGEESKELVSQQD